MDQRYIENPAINPTRQWVDSPECVLEAWFLVRRLDLDARQVIRFVAERIGSPCAPQEISVVTPNRLSERAIKSRVSGVNQFAEALGFVPLVSESESGDYVICSEASSVALQALARLNEKS